MAWHWYFTSALPRSLLGAFLLLPLGLWLEPRVRLLSGVALLYIALYSFLPHKEARPCHLRFDWLVALSV